jgi:hypothetical protein
MLRASGLLAGFNLNNRPERPIGGFNLCKFTIPNLILFNSNYWGRGGQ